MNSVQDSAPTGSLLAMLAAGRTPLVSIEDRMTNRDPNGEYHDLSENMRFYGNMRFAQLTLYFSKHKHKRTRKS